MSLKASQNQSKISLLDLWRQFIPLSLSDVAMACGDPMITTALAHLPTARTNLAAVGIAKALAIFFESPIIMLLHASNALAPQERSRRALWRFTLLAGGGLSALLLLLTIPFIFTTLAGTLLGIPSQLQSTVQVVLTLMILWPFSIAWRRYFQGLLIHTGNSQAVAQASIARLLIVGLVLLIGFNLKFSGAPLAGMALIAGVVVEALVVTLAARWLGATRPPELTDSELNLPSNLKSVWNFYWPLATSMLLVWGGRAVLVGIIARAEDADIALAAWPAAWGLVLVIANATRMVQQIIIKNRGRVSDRQLITFALSVGMLCSLLLLLGSTTPLGLIVVQSFVGSDPELVDGIRPVLLLCAFVPLLVAVQNATQGFLVGAGKTRGINRATWIGTIVLLLVAFLGIRFGLQGAIAAALAMIIALVTEVSCLALNISQK